MDDAKHIIKSHSGLIILTITIIVFFVVFWLLRNILLPFVVGLVLAYILIPAVSWLEKRFPKKDKWQAAKRVSTIVIFYIVAIAIVGTAGYYAVTSIVTSFTDIVNNLADYTSNAFEMIQGFLSNIGNFLPGTSLSVDGFLSDLGQNLGTTLQNLFSGIITSISSSFTYIIGFLSLPIFLFYILKDHEYINNRLYSWMSENTAQHARTVIGIINDVLGGYLRAELFMGLFVGVLALIGLLIIDVPLAIGLAVIAGITELVPILGPWIGGAIAVLVVIATDSDKVIWVIILFFAVQLIENTLLAPRIQGQFMHVHPAVAIILIIAGSTLAGFWGLILAVPLASTIVKLYQYVVGLAREEDRATLVSQ